MPHEMERASTLSGCAFVEIASPSRITRSPAHGPARPPIAQLSGSKSSCPSHDIGTWTRASENDRAMEVHIIKEDPARTLASVPPGLVQKILHFLPLDKVHEAKQVSKLYRSAAHSAMTRGRWKPVRLVAEHFKRHVMPPSLPLCRAAWDLDPSETLKLALTWPGPAAAQFLALVEPSLDGLERILRACEPVRRFAMRRYKLATRQLDGSVPFRVIAEWAKRIGTPITGQRGQPYRALVLRGLSRALRTWTSAKVAVDYFLKWLQILGEIPRMGEFTRNCEDSKAWAFVTAFAFALSTATARARQRFKCCTECSRRGVKECRPPDCRRGVKGCGRKCWTCKKWNRKCSLVYVNDYRDTPGVPTRFEIISEMPSFRWP